jgi:hypothetical protein
MEKEQILRKVEDCMERCDAEGLANSVAELLKVTNDEDACEELSKFLSKRYTTFKADSTAKMMEIIIRTRPILAMLKFPGNYLFRVAVLHGSMDLYECYIEEAIEPFLKGKTEDETFECYLDLSSLTEKLNEALFPQYVRCVKGMDFNSAFARYEKNDNVLLINQEDYEILEDVVEKYNTIVGRKNILIDLEKRAGMGKEPD